MTDISGEQSLNLNDFLMEIFIGYPIIKGAMRGEKSS